MTRSFSSCFFFLLFFHIQSIADFKWWLSKKDCWWVLAAQQVSSSSFVFLVLLSSPERLQNVTAANSCNSLQKFSLSACRSQALTFLRPAGFFSPAVFTQHIFLYPRKQRWPLFFYFLFLFLLLQFWEELSSEQNCGMGAWWCAHMWCQLVTITLSDQEGLCEFATINLKKLQFYSYTY